MFDNPSFPLFLIAASVVALTPGPAIMYVAARTLAGGRREGLASTAGAAIGGLVHVAASALGLSAVIMASAQIFEVIKYAGAAYLVWLGIKMWMEASTVLAGEVEAQGAAVAFRDGIVVEILNPKMAAFFLAFLPQFIDPLQSVFLQLVVLGTIVVVLNALVDLAVIVLAVKARGGLLARPERVIGVRRAAAGVIGSIGLSLLLLRRQET